MSFDIGNYNDVASRMREFFEKHPDGRLCPHVPWRVESIGDKTFVVYEAAAYRTADDPRPGVGVAWEPFPGRTPYTRDSELQNAETSAWGRAILAVGAADTRKGIASAEEVRNRREESWEVAKPPTVAQAKEADEIRAAVDVADTERALRDVGEIVRTARAQHLITDAQYDQLARHAAKKLAELRVGSGDGDRDA